MRDNLVVADASMGDAIFELYKEAVCKVNEGPVRLGWNTEIYPDRTFIQGAVSKGEMLTFYEKDQLVGAAVVNYSVNPEYDLIDWQVKEPKEKISTIHALAIAPAYWGKGYSGRFLQAIIDWCREKGDVANHLDVIDTNTFAEQLYLRCGFHKIKDIEMYYEVVGTRSFAMLEYVF